MLPQANAMKPSFMIEALRTLTKVNQPAFIWGPPGVGKSQLVAQVAAEQKKEMIDIRAVLLDPVDLRGLPHLGKDNTARWATPDFLPQEGEGILFLDELNAAPPLVQAACYQLTLDRKIGEYTLPDGWSVLAAGNRETDRSVTSRMPSALANRFIHLDFVVDLDDWCHRRMIAEWFDMKLNIDVPELIISDGTNDQNELFDFIDWSV